MSEDKVSINKNMIYGGVIIVLVAFLAFSFLSNGFGGQADCNVPQAANTQPAGAPTAPTGNTAPPATGSVVNISNLMDDDITMGSSTAAVVIVEFSDLQCPFCRKFWSESFSQIKTNYIDTGKVEYVFRDFPLSFHASAQKAGEAIECAREQNKGWEFHDKAYTEQNKLGSGTVQFTVADMKTWAGVIGLNSTKFDSCLDSGKYTTEVIADMNDGTAFGVSGTPAFFIAKRDGSKVIPVTGAQPYSIFKSTIDSLLN